MNDKPTPENEATAHEAVQLGTPPDGFRAVAAFRQPIPMRAMTKLCDALVMAYGEDAKIDPAGNWIGVFGRIPDEEKAEAFANTMKGEGPPTDCDPTATYEVVTTQEHGQEPRQHRVIPGTGKAEDFEADPGGHPARKFWWRACEQRPLAPEDGAKFYAADHKAAALELVKRHPEVMEYPTIFVWPDGENPTQEGERMNVAAIQTVDLPQP